MGDATKVVLFAGFEIRDQINGINVDGFNEREGSCFGLQRMTEGVAKLSIVGKGGRQGLPLDARD